MLVVDAQIHLWAGAGSSPRHGSQPFTVEEALAGMDAAGVNAAVIHPPGWDPGATAYAAEAVRRWPHRFARYETVDLGRPDREERVRQLHATPGVLGLRFLCMEPGQRSWPYDGSLDWVCAMAESLGMPIVLCGPVLMPVVARLAQAHPALKIVVDHFGVIAYGRDGGLVQATDVLHWAHFPQVSVKLTGAPDYATDAYPFGGMAQVVRELYDAYGARRLFWGTDITRVNGHGGTRHKATWAQCVAMFTEHMPWLPAEDLGAIMGSSYCRWHNWWPCRATQSDHRTTDENWSKS